MGRHRSRSLEAVGVIDRRLEGQRGDEAHARRTHQALADRVLLGELAGPVIELAEGLIQHQAGIQQR